MSNPDTVISHATTTVAQAAADALIHRLENMELTEPEAERLTHLLNTRARVDSFERDKSGFLQEDGRLIMARWAEDSFADRRVHDEGPYLAQGLTVHAHAQPQTMVHTKATGRGLVSNGFLGVDLIRAPAGTGFAPHTHPGDHLLIVVAGEGTITYDGSVYPTHPGTVYMIEGAIPHAVGAITDHAILAVGAPHRPVDAVDRQTLVEYADVLAELGEMHCLICDVVATYPARLPCPHDPTRHYPEGWRG